MRKPRIQTDRLGVRVGAVIALIGLADFLFAGKFLQDWIIIEFGIRAYTLNLEISLGLMSSGVVVMIIGGVYIFIKRLRNRPTSAAQNPAETLTSPEYTRKHLQQLQSSIDYAEPNLVQGANQMNKMDKLQARLATLIKLNDASYLQDTTEVLDKVEKHLCRNLIKVINLFIAADNPRSVDLPKVQQYLHDNEKKLNDSQTLLDVAASWINHYDADQSNYDEIETWITTIRESLKED